MRKLIALSLVATLVAGDAMAQKDKITPRNISPNVRV